MFCYFNSIKVRLELGNTTPILFLHQFQFHKGTIRTIPETSPYQLYNHFNSIKVRLEQLNPLKVLVKILFQFHKGTIRTENGWIYTADSSIFQFHKGTIRTPCIIAMQPVIDISIP